MNLHLILSRLAASVIALLLISSSATAQEPVYAGKSVRVIHGFGTGGGFDTAARVVTKHLSKHVPGNPEFIVESMPGAAGLVAMNYMFNKADNDGLTMGFLLAPLVVNEVTGDPAAQFESSKFRWLGAPSGGTPVCSLMASSGIKSVDDWKNSETPVKIGSTSPGADPVFAAPKLLETQTDLPIQIILGHQGGNPALKLAAERGEIDGFCASLEATQIVLGEELKSGKANVIVQFGDEADPAIPDVALANDLVTTESGNDLIHAVLTGPQKLNRVFAFPPETPDEMVSIMRTALMETFEDPEFVEDAAKVKVNVNPVDGETAAQIIEQIGALSDESRASLRDLLSPG